MATVKRGRNTARRIGASGRRRISRSSLVVVLLLAFVAAWYWREPMFGYARAGTAFGAHTACSCRHIGGRELSDCAKDFEPGMEFVFLSEDEDERSVTAWVPLLASETAHYSEGRGCLLDKWDD